MNAAKIIISGTVQGVSFRSFAKKNAENAKLNGYAKNLESGKVEVFLEGNPDDIETVIEALRSGPRGAAVKKVDVQWQKSPESFKDFKIIY